MKSYVWEEKEKRAERARAHTKYMEDNYKECIQDSIHRSIIYEPDWSLPEEDEEGNELYNYKDSQYKIIVEPMTTSEAIAKYGSMISKDFSSNNGIKKYNKVAVLNFASFKNPGGMFINGSRAQEECLCHDSDLYNVLSRFQRRYYDVNKTMLNNALYESRILYTPDIMFDFKYDYIDKNNHKILSRIITSVDVITAAAPNATTYLKYKRGPKEMIYAAMTDRITKIISIAAEHQIDTLILGAYGCGVFGNDPKMVSEIFKKVIEAYHKAFKNINFIFAIPTVEGNYKYNENYNTFKKIEN